MKQRILFLDNTYKYLDTILCSVNDKAHLESIIIQFWDLPDSFIINQGTQVVVYVLTYTSFGCCTAAD